MCTRSFLRHHQHGVCTHAFAEARSTDVGHSHELGFVLPEWHVDVLGDNAGKPEMLPIWVNHSESMDPPQEGKVFHASLCKHE